jgi:hypothetical protein
LILKVSDHFEVIGIAAKAIVAEMVDLFLAGDVAVVVGEHHQMHSHSGVVQAHAAIAATFAVTGMWTCPYPAGTGEIMKQKAHVFELDTGHYLFENVLASGKEHLVHLFSHFKNQEKRCTSYPIPK